MEIPRMGPFDYAIVFAAWFGPAVAIFVAIAVFHASRELTMLAAFVVGCAAHWVNEKVSAKF